MRQFPRIAFGLLLLVLPACASTVVKKNPGEHDRGVRYYRPKPYLNVTPAYNVNTGTAVPSSVTLNLEYLPDFSEEYSIHVRAGVGTNKTSVTLEDGWNLTALNVEVDSKFNENVTALSNLVKGFLPGAGGATPSSGGSPQKTAVQPVVVQASNVPLGYYEAVISPGRDGKKRLYGWRYVGFAPFAACPLEGSGVECLNCESGAIYGLVTFDNMMVFKQLGEVAATVPNRGPAVPAEEATQSSTSAVSAEAIEKVRKAVAADLITQLAAKGESITDGDVTIQFVQSRNQFDVTVSLAQAAAQRLLTADATVADGLAKTATTTVARVYANTQAFKARVILSPR